MRKMILIYRVTVTAPTQEEIVNPEPSNSKYECDLSWLKDSEVLAGLLKNEVSGFGFHEGIEIGVEVLDAAADSQ